MVNHMSPAELNKDYRIWAAFVLVLAGVAAWDVLSTLWFDLSIVMGKRKWRWPMAIYFVCRIAMLLHIFAFAVNLNAISEIPCMSVTWISKVSDAIGTCGSSLILILRTRAVWHRDLKVTILLGALFIGQAMIWIQTFRYSKAKWDPKRGVCAVIANAPKNLLICVFAYTMAFDFVILCLCSFKLSTARRSSSLAAVLLRDGIGYFTAAFIGNFIQAVITGLRLSPVLNIIALPFALVVSVIAATTVFRNVFTLYDSFSHEPNSNGPNGGSGGAPNFPAVNGNTSIGLKFLAERTTVGSRTQIGTETITVHKHVDVEGSNAESIDIEKGRGL